MKLRFWGVRGSIPTPGPDTVRYGGNTTCIEIRTEGGELIILDAGTGIHALAQRLLAELPVRAHLFVTHTHWDHIHGLPFFLPLFIPGNHVAIHGPFDPISGEGIEQIMNVQMQYSFFPVREAELRAAMEYHSLAPGQPVEIGDTRITPILLNHPVINYGYRIDSAGKSVFFTGDHEPHANIYAASDSGYDDYQVLIDEKRREIDALLAGVDVMIADSSYTATEYAGKRGWGHGTLAGSIEWARRIGARRLYCTHHEPTRSDDALEAAFTEALDTSDAGDCEVLLAREGHEYVW